MNLVKSINLLSQKAVKRADIEEARTALIEFSLDIEKKWGKELMFINFHDITHLPDQVLKTGPLWVYSGFFAESALGYYVKCKFEITLLIINN